MLPIISIAVLLFSANSFSITSSSLTKQTVRHSPRIIRQHFIEEVQSNTLTLQSLPTANSIESNTTGNDRTAPSATSDDVFAGKNNEVIVNGRKKEDGTQSKLGRKNGKTAKIDRRDNNGHGLTHGIGGKLNDGNDWGQNATKYSTAVNNVICSGDEKDKDAMYDAQIRRLYASLVEKVSSYQPSAVLAITTASMSDSNNGTVGELQGVNNHTKPILQKAFEFSREAHKHQCRKSGEPYIIHPLGVAHIIADMRLDLPSLLTALLHDTVEDTAVSLDDIDSLYGHEIASLVDGVTKVGKIPLASVEEVQSENYRKLILSMSRDIRVLLVKLADRLHNMRTLEFMNPQKQKRIAKETIEIYAPLAHRLGIHWLKTELEDQCFKYLKPGDYNKLHKLVTGSEGERRQYEQQVVDLLSSQMEDAGIIPADISGRTKGLFSIFNKMTKKDIEFDEVHDIVGFRIIVDDVPSCYAALGVVHSHSKPVPGKIKDYVALPKPNGYQSLHTTVRYLKGKLEVQIRTRDMHSVAESGIAAHFVYKEGGRMPKVGKNEQFAWLRQLVDDVRQQSDPLEFVSAVKEDLFQRECFVFSPRGDLYALARGSSVLDFAFKVHSGLGSRCVGARVNGKMVSMKHNLNNGDTVEILTSNKQKPKKEWLKYVRTSKAKSRIRSWLKRQQRDRSLASGKRMLEREIEKYSADDTGRKQYHRKMEHVLTTFDLKDEEHLLVALGYGQISLESVMIEVFGAAAVKTRGNSSQGDKREIDDEFVRAKLTSDAVGATERASGKHGIVVGKERNIMLTFCKNCRPLHGEPIRGVVTKGKGVKVHRLGCEVLLQADDNRIVDVRWDGGDLSGLQPRLARIEALCEDSPGVLANLSRAITSLGVNIGNVSLRKLSNGRGLARMDVPVRSLEEFESLLAKVRNEDGIINVTRR